MLILPPFSARFWHLLSQADIPRQSGGEQGEGDPGGVWVSHSVPQVMLQAGLDAAFFFSSKTRPRPSALRSGTGWYTHAICISPVRHSSFSWRWNCAGSCWYAVWGPCTGVPDDGEGVPSDPALPLSAASSPLHSQPTPSSHPCHQHSAVSVPVRGEG